MNRRSLLSRSPLPAAPIGQNSALHLEESPTQSAIAPPIVHEVLDTPGQSLDPVTRQGMESQLGHEFGSVQVHTDAKAAASAEAVNALAYTVGRNVVFAAGQYQPKTPQGRSLLAHELTHVVQQSVHDAGGDHPIEIGRADTIYEAEAEQQSEHSSQSSSQSSGKQSTSGHQEKPQQGIPHRVMQRSVKGGIIGGILGGVAGAALGAFLGPVGAIVGGLVGLVVGAAIGNDATTRSRNLAQPEIDMAQEIFQDSLNYRDITITRDSLYAVGAPRTIGNTIHLKSDWGHFVGDTLELSDRGKETLIHEMTHVWQYQNGGLAYMPLSIIAQIRAAVGSGNRNAAYNWRAAHNAGTPWENWNPEQQAEAVEDYNKLLQKVRAGTATAEDYQSISILLPYINRIRRRQGAPTFGIGGDDGGQLTGRGA
ncbi:MAG: DUF4157 domain-containing protein [Oscillatoriophycideae cyanobacterium NC_groundwater_1537_Pr4_S-0.65um_50_18]|nr:DUF4157 domain-containing protein [Oscillatoriophycideae cyanobacterium NC_groundwater_1537_Pr4_S-0.65um_50_18]